MKFRRHAFTFTLGLALSCAISGFAASEHHHKAKSTHSRSQNDEDSSSRSHTKKHHHESEADTDAPKRKHKVAGDDDAPRRRHAHADTETERPLSRHERKLHELRLAAKQRKAHEARLAAKQNQLHEKRLAAKQRQAHENRLAAKQRKGHESRLAAKQRELHEHNVRLAEREARLHRIKLRQMSHEDRVALKRHERRLAQIQQEQNKKARKQRDHEPKLASMANRHLTSNRKVRVADQQPARPKRLSLHEQRLAKLQAAHQARLAELAAAKQAHESRLAAQHRARVAQLAAAHEARLLAKRKAAAEAALRHSAAVARKLAAHNARLAAQKAHYVAMHGDDTSGRSIHLTQTMAAGVPVKVITVDLNDHNVKVSAVMARQGNGTSEPFRQMIDRANPNVAVTGTFFSLDNLRPVGDIVIDGSLVHFGGMGTALCVTENNHADMVTCQWGRHHDWSGYEFVVACGPRLLHDSRIVLDPHAERFKDRHMLAPNSRIAVGITRGNKLVFVMTREPIYLGRLAKVMRGLGCREAMNLDAGTSTGFYYNGTTLAKPGRKLTNMIVVYGDKSRYEKSLDELVPEPYRRQRVSSHRQVSQAARD